MSFLIKGLFAADDMPNVTPRQCLAGTNKMSDSHNETGSVRPEAPSVNSHATEGVESTFDSQRSAEGAAVDWR